MQLDETAGAQPSNDATPPEMVEIIPYSAAWESQFRMSVDGWMRALEALGVDPKGPATSTPGGRVRTRKASTTSGAVTTRTHAPGEPTTAWGFALRELGDSANAFRRHRAIVRA